MQLPATHGSWPFNAGFAYILTFKNEKVWGLYVLKWEESLLCFLIIKKSPNQHTFEYLFINMFPSREYSLQFLRSQLNILLLRSFLQPGQN